MDLPPPENVGIDGASNNIQFIGTCLIVMIPLTSVFGDKRITDSQTSPSKSLTGFSFKAPRPQLQPRISAPKRSSENHVALVATCLLHSVPETESRCSPDRSGLSNSCRIKYRGGASCTSSVPVSSFRGAAAVGACSGCREDISVWRSRLPVQATSSRGSRFGYFHRWLTSLFL